MPDPSYQSSRIAEGSTSPNTDSTTKIANGYTGCLEDFLQSMKCDRSFLTTFARPGLKEPILENTVSDLGGHVAAYFQELGFSEETPLPIAPPNITTFFTSAGVQILEPLIHHGIYPSQYESFVRQPVIRLHDVHSYEDGSCLAFTNLATEVPYCGPREHFIIMKHWLALLCELGIDPDDIQLEARGPVEQKWGDCGLRGHSVAVSVNGLEIGDACYHFDIEGQSGLAISDIGFGEERILYALTGKSLYSQIFNASSYSAEYLHQVDCLHAITLAITSGVNSASHGPGLRLKRIMAELAEVTSHHRVDFIDHIRTSHAWWVERIPLYRSPKATHEAFAIQFSEAVNKLLLLHLVKSGANVSLTRKTQCSTKEFLRRLQSENKHDLHIQLLGIKYPIHIQGLTH